MDGGVPGGAGGGPGAGPLRFRLLHRAIRWECLRVKPPSDVLIVISKDGRSSKPFVFTIHSQQMSHAAQSLDVAADTQEELSEWVAKIREATQNADARVRGCRGWALMVPFSWRWFLISPKEESRGETCSSCFSWCRCKRGRSWSGGRKSPWSSRSWSCIAGRCRSMRTVSPGEVG